VKVYFKETEGNEWKDRVLWQCYECGINRQDLWKAENALTRRETADCLRTNLLCEV